MKKTMLVLLVILLSACATDRPPEDTEKGASGPSVYGELGVSVDWVLVEG